MEFEYTKEQEVANVSMERPHVVILGAGASRAACPKGDRNGKLLPVMNDFSEIVGLKDLLLEWKLSQTINFEELFSDLFVNNETEKIKIIQDRIEIYFKSLELPEFPTIYDHLVLSLREKDIIATFNWDPFLFQAYMRNSRIGLSLPQLSFLHGNVGIGYCLKDKMIGQNGKSCPKCKTVFSPTQLLYPIKKKDYASDRFISDQWELLRWGFKNAYSITLFGYGGPKTDKEAIQLMSQAWGKVEDRYLEQTEFITLDTKRKITSNWKQFIHTHHYDIRRNFYESWIAKHPRRSVEAYWTVLLENKFIEDNRIPHLTDFSKLWGWFKQFIPAEDKVR